MKRSRVLRKLSFLLSLAMIITSISVPVMAGTISAEDAPVIAEVTEDADTESFGITVATEDADAEYFGNVTNNEDVSPDEAKSYTDPDTGFYFEINDDNTAEITGYLNLGHSYDSLGDLNIPGTVKNDAGETFTVTSIGYQAFKSDTRFDGKLTIPDTVTDISAEAFDGCVNLKGSLIIPDSVVHIEFDAFRECNGMDGELKLGKNLEYIRDRAFKGCSNLKGDITIPASMIQIGESAFQGCTGFHGHLYFGEGSLEHIYKNAFSGLNITGGLTFPGRVSNIHDRAFYECKSLNGPLVFAKGVGYIGDFAFTDCKGLTGDLSLDTGDGDQTTIKDNSFKNCKNLGPVLTLGEKATWDNSMGMYSHSFLYCYGIKKVVNKSNNKFTLSALKSDDSKDKVHSWVDENGKTIYEITNGTAYRDDYAPEDEDQYYTITMQDGSEAFDPATDKLMYEAKEGDLVGIQWAYFEDDKEFVRWESQNKGVKFADKNNWETTFVMPAENVTITYVEKAKGAPDPDDPDPDDPDPDDPEKKDCPVVITKQKVDLSAKEYFNTEFDKSDKWQVEPKGFGSVSKGIFTAKKPGEVTVTRMDKSKNVLGTVKFTIETPEIDYPVNPKNGKKLTTKTYYRINEEIDVTELISTKAGLTPVKYECSDKKGKNFEFDGQTNKLTVKKSGSCKINVYYNYGNVDKYAAKYTINIKSSLPKLKEKVSVKANKSTTVTLSNVQKGTKISWWATETDKETGEAKITELVKLEEVPGSDGRKCKITAGDHKGAEVILVALVGEEKDGYFCKVTIK